MDPWRGGEGTQVGDSSAAFGRLLDLVRRLRGPGGCPWDRAQTHESLRRYVLEESREVVVAIEGGRPAALRDELGDLLLQVLLHAAIADEAAEFTMADVLNALEAKLIRRHPHVFGGADAVAEPAEVERRWAEIKAVEAAASGTAEVAAAARADHLAAVQRSQGPLAEAQALGARAGEVGFDWPDAEQAWPKLAEEADEFAAAWRAWTASGDTAGPLRRAAEDELGDLLFATVNVVRLLGLDAEVAMVSANAKFRRRFGQIEARLGPGAPALRAAGAAALESAWQRVKAEEKAGAQGAHGAEAEA